MTVMFYRPLHLSLPLVGAGTGSQAVPCRQGTHSQACSRQHQDIMVSVWFATVVPICESR